MADWTHLLGPLGKTLGAPEAVRAFEAREPGIDAEVRVAADCLVIEGPGKQSLLERFFHRGQSVRIYEVHDPVADSGLLLYRATLRTEGANARGSLEMRCCFPGRGEFFSKGAPIGQVVEGDSDWTDLEIPFLLRQGEIPNLVRLNVMVEGAGRVRVRDVELLFAPLVAAGELTPAAAPEGRGDEAAAT